MGFNLVSSKFCWEFSSNNSLNSSFESQRGNLGSFFFFFFFPHLALKLKWLNFEKYIYFFHLPQGKNWLTITELIPTTPWEDESFVWRKQHLYSLSFRQNEYKNIHSTPGEYALYSVLIPSIAQTSSLSGNKAALLHNPLPFAFQATVIIKFSVTIQTVHSHLWHFGLFTFCSRAICLLHLSHSHTVSIESRCTCQMLFEGLEPATIFSVIGFDIREVSCSLTQLNCQWSCLRLTSFPVLPCQYHNPCSCECVCVCLYVFVCLPCLGHDGINSMYVCSWWVCLCVYVCAHVYLCVWKCVCVSGGGGGGWACPYWTSCEDARCPFCPPCLCRPSLSWPIQLI